MPSWWGRHWERSRLSALVGRLHERPEVCDAPVARVDGAVVGDVVAVVAQRRGLERQQPQAIDAQLRQVVELRG